MAQVMSERLEADAVSVLHVNNDYGQQLADRFAETFDGEINHQVAFNKGESSYSSVIDTALSPPDS
jgi:hypothetical protein